MAGGLGCGHPAPQICCPPPGTGGQSQAPFSHSDTRSSRSKPKCKRAVFLVQQGPPASQWPTAVTAEPGSQSREADLTHGGCGRARNTYFHTIHSPSGCKTQSIQKLPGMKGKMQKNKATPDSTVTSVVHARVLRLHCKTTGARSPHFGPSVSFPPRLRPHGPRLLTQRPRAPAADVSGAGLSRPERPRQPWGACGSAVTVRTTGPCPRKDYSLSVGQGYMY